MEVVRLLLQQQDVDVNVQAKVSDDNYAIHSNCIIDPFLLLGWQNGTYVVPTKWKYRRRGAAITA